MKTLNTFTLMLILVMTCITSLAQQPTNLGKWVEVGNPADQDSARIDLTTQSDIKVNLISATFHWTNGPLSEPNYLNHTLNWGYNQNAVGNKVIQDNVNFGLACEAKYYTGTRWVTECHWNWQSPDGSIARRPLGWDIDYATGNLDTAWWGRWTWMNNNGAPWAYFNGDGTIDLRPLEGGVIVFKNNTNGILWAKANEPNSINPIRVNEWDQVSISPGGYPILLGGPTTASTIDASGNYKVNGLKVVGSRCAAIADAITTSRTDAARAVNEVLTCMRQHGLVAQ